MHQATVRRILSCPPSIRSSAHSIPFHASHFAPPLLQDPVLSLSVSRKTIASRGQQRHRPKDRPRAHRLPRSPGPRWQREQSWHRRCGSTRRGQRKQSWRCCRRSSRWGRRQRWTRRSRTRWLLVSSDLSYRKGHTEDDKRGREKKGRPQGKTYCQSPSRSERRWRRWRGCW